ncbi:hypothetical protein SBA2_270085 [Acidobacteriia bacterium SbA2]|nr:hypothetical protein SBA2_270085 [Acidobacteriia bacterium SbA2]
MRPGLLYAAPDGAPMKPRQIPAMGRLANRIDSYIIAL